MIDLEHQFELELEDKMFRAKKCQYNPTLFNQMLVKYGAVGTAKRLISNARATRTISDGFTTLYLCGRLSRDCSATCEALQSEHKRARYGIIHARKNEGIARKACIWDGGADV